MQYHTRDTRNKRVQHIVRMCVVCTLNRSFYPTTSPRVRADSSSWRDTNYVVTDCCCDKQIKPNSRSASAKKRNNYWLLVTCTDCCRHVCFQQKKNKLRAAVRFWRISSKIIVVLCANSSRACAGCVYRSSLKDIGRRLRLRVHTRVNIVIQRRSVLNQSGQRIIPGTGTVYNHFLSLVKLHEFNIPLGQRDTKTPSPQSIWAAHHTWYLYI